MIKQFTYEESRLNYFVDKYNKAKDKYLRVTTRINKLPKPISPLSEESLELDEVSEEYNYYKDIVYMLTTKGYIPNSTPNPEDVCELFTNYS